MICSRLVQVCAKTPVYPLWRVRISFKKVNWQTQELPDFSQRFGLGEGAGVGAGVGAAGALAGVALPDLLVDAGALALGLEPEATCALTLIGSTVAATTNNILPSALSLNIFCL
ncbi:hypothetical protein MCEGE14_00599 [Burkholderiaceae bacterium]